MFPRTIHSAQFLLFILLLILNLRPVQGLFSLFCYHLGFNVIFVLHFLIFSTKDIFSLERTQPELEHNILKCAITTKRSMKTTWFKKIIFTFLLNISLFHRTYSWLLIMFLLSCSFVETKSDDGFGVLCLISLIFII